MSFIPSTSSYFQIFRHLELPSEISRLENMRQTVQRERQNFLDTIANNSHSVANLGTLLSVQLAEYEKAVQDAAQSGLLLDAQNQFPPATEKWSIVQAIFFCSTVITSIGYGSLVPVTFKGRIFCMLYALIGNTNWCSMSHFLASTNDLVSFLPTFSSLLWTGIPLTLTVIADWGKLFASAVSIIGKHLSGGFSSSIPYRVNPDFACPTWIVMTSIGPSLPPCQQVAPRRSRKTVTSPRKDGSMLWWVWGRE